MNNTLQSWEIKIFLWCHRGVVERWGETDFIEVEILNDIFIIDQEFFKNIMRNWQFSVSTPFYVKHIFGQEKGIIQTSYQEEKTHGPYLFKNKLENSIKCLDGVLNYNARYYYKYTPAPLSSFINLDIIKNIRKTTPISIEFIKNLDTILNKEDINKLIDEINILDILE